MSRESILIVEDDPVLLRGLKDNFEFEGYDVVTAADGQAGLDAAMDGSPDLIILDIMLPKVNGYEVCRRLRDEGLRMPIIMLTAKGEEPDVVLGLNIGADDYVTKPFSVRELCARVKAFLRRGQGPSKGIYRFGPFEINVDSHKLLRNGQEVELTPKEFGVLELLVTRPGRALTRDQILDAVWGHGVFVTARSVDRCVTTLRSKIEADLSHPAYIVTVREVGYRFGG